jgi:hypothetical protein
MQIKVTLRFHLTLVRSLSLIKQTTNAGEDKEEKEHLLNVNEIINLCSHYGNQNGGSTKV